MTCTEVTFPLDVTIEHQGHIRTVYFLELTCVQNVVVQNIISLTCKMEPPKNIMSLKNKTVANYNTYSSNLNDKSHILTHSSQFNRTWHLLSGLWALTTLLFQDIFSISLHFSFLYQRRQKPGRPTRSTKKQIPVALCVREFLLKRKYHFWRFWVTALDRQNACETSCI